MFAFIGLGNPEKKYERTPHNAGFLCVDELCRRHGVELAGLGAILQFRRARLYGHEVVLAKPMTYMNESGLAVRKLCRMFTLEPPGMLLIYDDADLPLGRVRLRERGSAGTHKGMKSVIRHVGGQDFPRLRIGIQGPGPRPVDIVRYVLTPLRGKAFAAFQEGIVQAADAAEAFLQVGIYDAMNQFNRRNDSLLLPREEAKASTRRKHD
ncbi:MAG: aminoacyl-tRNA hydrolase [Candidatus Aminicenantes bacterium]|nr:aminoacyl-tRNA hydrolase [Candidatus Aminicenantes bacterium]